MRDMQTYAGVTAEQLWAVARRNGVIRMRVFGSWARGEARPDSDLDLLIMLEPGRTLFDLSRLKDELDAVVGSPVDVITEGGLSPYIRDKVLSEAVPL
jgi:predicted nucleotidyltransferase